jgi:alpha-beta hydrolase superfamily lysophospholipase
LELRVWDVEAPKGVVILVHGLGEHGGRYAEVAAHLNNRGFCVVAPDHRGHGRSEGAPTHTPSFDHLLDDLDRVEQVVFSTDLPLAIWGHSLGGLITLRYLQRCDTRARVAVISSPWLGRPGSATWWKTGPARLVGALWPSAPLPSGVKGRMLTHDRQKQFEYDNDPLVRRTVTPRLFAEGSKAVAEAFKDAKRVTGELLFLVPLADELVNPPETLKFIAGLPSDGCTVISRSEWRHEPHNELDRASLLPEICDWLESKLMK